MGYFRELPDLEYQSFLSNRLSNSEYIRVKNLFRRNKLRDDLQSVFTLFDKYEIPEGARPDTIAEELYGSSELDWVILLTANITNVRDQWPLSNRDLYNFAEKKYGIQHLNSIHHYETKEVRDAGGKLILPAGKIVDSNFSITYYDLLNVNGYNILTQEYLDATTDAQRESLESQGKKYAVGYIKVSPVVGVSNYDYEVKKNDEKSSIYLLKPGYIQQFLNDMRFNMIYGKSSEYVNDKLAKTDNTRIIGQ